MSIPFFWQHLSRLNMFCFLSAMCTPIARPHHHSFFCVGRDEFCKVHPFGAVKTLPSVLLTSLDFPFYFIVLPGVSRLDMKCVCVSRLAGKTLEADTAQIVKTTPGNIETKTRTDQRFL